MINSNDLRDTIFSLHTRKFGGVVEKLVERILVEFGFVVDKAKDNSYDIEINSKSDEIKGSRVLIKSKLNLEVDNIVEELINHKYIRYVSLEDSSNYEWGCNIQQIKTKLFENLWYVLFFGDCVAVFKIPNNKIIEDKEVLYSNKQHRGNIDEGQFHVTNKNIKHHLSNYLIKTITYDEVLNKLNNKRNS